MLITRGPLGWYDLNGALRKIYYVITNYTFHFKLEKVGQFLGANPLAQASGTKAASGSSLEEMVARVLPAVVTIKSGEGSGSGFFILDTGVLVTNKHVVAGNPIVSIITPELCMETALE